MSPPIGPDAPCAATHPAMLDPWDAALEWGAGTVMAILTATHGPAYRNVGAALAIAHDGRFAGAITSGCVEADLILRAAQVREDGRVQNLRYGQGSQFFDLRLPCGGAVEIRLFVEGERFVRSLQGEPIPLTDTKRGGFGNSKVLAPELRDPLSAYLVTRWLIEKAAARLRREGRVASNFSLHIGRENAAPLGRSIKCAASQDTAIFLRINRSLWRKAWPYLQGQHIGTVGIQLGKVDLLEQRNGDLLRTLPAAERTRGEKAAAAVDFINGRFGSGSITYGVNVPHPGFFERG